MRIRAGLFAVVMALAASNASAHVALSSVDVHIRAEGVDIAVVGQAFDFAHELGIDPPEKLMDLAFLAQQQDAIARMVDGSIIVSADGAVLTGAAWSVPAAAPEQQLIRIRTTFRTPRTPGRVTVSSRLFAYDSAHQTLVNVYEGDAIVTQQMLDADRLQMDYFAKTRAGLISILKRFLVAGVQQTLTGYNLLLFIAALFLLGAPTRRAAAIGAAFTCSCLAAFALGASRVVSVPMSIVAPGVALSVVYASVDNLMIRGGRDLRVWVALAFGWVHGFALAAVLAGFDRPLQRFTWAAVSFAAGVEASVALAVIAVLAVASLSSAQGDRSRRAFTLAGSLVIAAAGTASFVRGIL